MIRPRFLARALLIVPWFTAPAIAPHLTQARPEVAVADPFTTVTAGCAVTVPRLWLDGTPLALPHTSRHLNLRDAIGVEVTSLPARDTPPLEALLNGERQAARRDPGLVVTILQRSARSFMLRFERPVQREVRYLATARGLDDASLCRLDVYEYDHDPGTVRVALALLSSLTVDGHAEEPAPP